MERVGQHEFPWEDTNERLSTKIKARFYVSSACDLQKHG